MNESSLSNLRDIVLPAEPGLWPLAPGMWLLISSLLSLLAWILWTQYDRRKRNAYRRAGLLLLPEVQTNYELSVLLKRVALAAFPREQVASLHGDAWVAFLKESCPAVDLSGLLAGDAGQDAGNDLKREAATWIRSHSPAVEKLGKGDA
jgi:hypothetical protein